jgi:hypothetical protein
MIDAKLLAGALKEMGMDVDAVSVNHIVANSGRGYIEFKRKAGTKQFTASGDLRRLDEIKRAYAVGGVRKFARAKGWSMRQNEDRIVLTRY